MIDSKVVFGFVVFMLVEMLLLNFVELFFLLDIWVFKSSCMFFGDVVYDNFWVVVFEDFE